MSLMLKGVDLPKEKDAVIKIKPNGKVLKQLAFETVFVETEAEAIQIDKPWKECSCYQCKHRGTAPYEKPCSVCARNHKDYFEEI